MKYLPLILANLRRSPLRSALTASAVAFAIALVCLLRTMPEALQTILAYAASGTRLVVSNKAGFEYPLPYADLARVRALPGVTAAASWTWYGGMFEPEKGSTFPSFATEPDALDRVFPEFGLSEAELAEFVGRRDAAVVGRSTARSYGWKAGDRVALVGDVVPVNVELQLVSVLPYDLSPVLLFHREYLEQALVAAGASLDSASLFYVRVDDRARVEPLRAEIDAMFRNSAAQTQTQTEQEYFKSLFSGLDAFVAIAVAVTGLVTLCILFIAANTASLSVRERAAELAVLKALGFGKRLVFALLVIEAGVLSLVGGIVGALGSLGITLALTRATTDLMSQVGPLGSFVVTRAIVVQGVFLALFIGMLAGVVPSFGAARRGVAETMREVF
jgi:putative ABC transport system permease protein